MAKRKPTYIPVPRPFNEFQTAARLNRGVEWFRQNRARLKAEGFPDYDDLLGGWDSEAIDRWMDARSHIDLPATNYEAQALRVIRGKRTA